MESSSNIPYDLTSCDGEEPSPKRAKKGEQARKQEFLPAYSTAFPGIVPSSKGKFHAFCKHCNTDISISRSGKFDVKRHCGTDKHLANAKSATSATPIRDMFSKQKDKLASDTHDESVMKAEVMMVELLTQHNLPISAADSFTKAVKMMFTDSKIAQSFQCGRTKATYIARDLAKLHKDTLFERMRCGPFTISTDGSNDQGEKQFPVVVRTINPATNTVDSELLSLPVITDSATGEAIFNLLDAIMIENNIPWSNCLALGCDNASVMTGVHKGVFAFIKEKNPSTFLSGCTLHLVHLAAEKAAKSLPVSVADLLVDIFYFFKKSSLRQANFSRFQDLHSVDQKKMLKHVPTRWLSISRCLDRLLENWKPLKDFFKEQYSSSKTSMSGYALSKVKHISEALTSPSTKLYCLFLRYAVDIFEPFLTANQSDAPQIGQLHQNLLKLLREVLLKFVNPAGMANKKAIDVQFSLDYNLRSTREVLIGEDARQFIDNKKTNGLSEERLAEFYKNVFAYYRAVATYLKTNLPYHEPLMQHIEICMPEQITKEGMMAVNLPEVMRRFPCLTSKTDRDVVISQFADLQCFILSRAPEERLDHFWGRIKEENGERFAAICNLILGLLTVPHSSAHCERVFSCVRKTKTDFRQSLGQSTLEALMVIKHRKSPAIYDSATLKYLKGSTVRALSGAGVQ